MNRQQYWTIACFISFCGTSVGSVTFIEFNETKTVSHEIRMKSNDSSFLLSMGDMILQEEKEKINNAQHNLTDETYLQIQFIQSFHISKNISKKSNQNDFVTTVNVNENDTLEKTVYSIVSGNTKDAFYINETTGQIYVNCSLDFLRIPEYNLIVDAIDGEFFHTTTVKIIIEDISRDPPVFENHEVHIRIDENKFVEGCITKVKAFDPLLEKNNFDEKITYSIWTKEHKSWLQIDKSGCISMKESLDREFTENGEPWKVIVSAELEDSRPWNILETRMTVYITLDDYNDNAPFLEEWSTWTLWYENQPPGKIMKLEAKDFDSDINGSPFTFKIVDKSINLEIKEKFYIIGDYLYAKVSFNREERPEYIITINITDNGSPSQSGKSKLIVVIGDKNDNRMKGHSKSVVVYKYEGKFVSEDELYVDVEDPDDSDLGDKSFILDSELDDDFFTLNPKSGLIELSPNTKCGDYSLNFIVTEKSNFFNSHTVRSQVNVTVKEIDQKSFMNLKEKKNYPRCPKC